jgi:hypothetical protein
VLEEVREAVEGERPDAVTKVRMLVQDQGQRLALKEGRHLSLSYSPSVVS